MNHCNQPMLDMGTWPQHNAQHRPINIMMQAWKCSVCGKLVKEPATPEDQRRLELHERVA